MRPFLRRALAAAAAAAPSVLARQAHAQASSPEVAGWLPWLVLGAIALFVVGVIARMILSARFPKGYRQWARSRRDEFDARNERWDQADEEFRR
jgi:hypothetical protein